MSQIETLFSDHGQPALWLDYNDYAGALLAAGKPPWLDEAEMIAWLRKAQGLLKSSVILLPVDRLSAAWVVEHAALREAMARRQRSTYALKTLLADEGLRRYLIELARNLRAGFNHTPILLSCPSPTLWVQQAWQQVNSEPLACSAEDSDAASVYLADFLRGFGDVGLEGLLLQETADSEPASAEALQLYQPVWNVAEHYRWAKGLLAAAGRLTLNAESPLDFIISSEMQSAVPTGQVLTAGVWQGEAVADCTPPNFRYAVIPPAAEPESVLQRLAALRA